MTGLPKKKIARARRSQRTAAKGYHFTKLATCSNCGNLKLGHRICPICGYYKKRLIFEPRQTTKVTKVKEK